MTTTTTRHGTEIRLEGTVRHGHPAVLVHLPDGQVVPAHWWDDEQNGIAVSIGPHKDYAIVTAQRGDYEAAVAQSESALEAISGLAPDPLPKGWEWVNQPAGIGVPTFVPQLFQNLNPVRMDALWESDREALRPYFKVGVRRNGRSTLLRPLTDDEWVSIRDAE